MLPGLSCDMSLAAGRPITLGNSGTFASFSVSTVTGTSQDIGPADADRYVILFITTSDSATLFTVSSATVDGVSCTIAVDHGGATLGGSAARSCAIAIAKVPSSNTSVTITVNMSEVVSYSLQVDWVTVYGLTSTTALATNHTGNTSTTTIGASVSAPAGALTVACSTNSEDPTAVTWNFGAELFDKANATGTQRVSAVYAVNQSSSTPTITMTGGVSWTQAALCAASFG